MPSTFEYMQFATGVHASSDNNRIGSPAGWALIDWQPDKWTGFSAGVYKNESTDEIVISYTGTNDAIADPLNWTAGMGLPAPQIFDAMAYYFAVRASYPTANITFSGHSLGGGLASLMAVLFDKQAVVFDEAPFQLAAQNPLLLSLYAAAMAASGYVDAALTLYIASGGSLALTRESNVTQYYIDGEVLSTIRFSGNTLVGSDNSISLGNSTAGMIERHSMALMTALKASDSFLSVVRKLPPLVSLMLDGNLFAADSRDVVNDDLLRKLLRHQLGVIGAIEQDEMLGRFAADMGKLAQDGGLTMNDGNGPPDWNNVSKGLIAFAMQKYYEETTSSAGFNKELFSQITGGLQFDMADVSDKFNTAFIRHERLNLKDAKGYTEYLVAYFNFDNPNRFFTPEERGLINALLPYLRDWYVQAGAGGMNASDTLNHGAFMLGGAGDDKYVSATGDGLDTVLDSDGKGHISIDGGTLAGGAQYGDNRVHRDTDKDHYVQVDEKALIIDGINDSLVGYREAANDAQREMTA